MSPPRRGPSAALNAGLRNDARGKSGGHSSLLNGAAASHLLRLCSGRASSHGLPWGRGCLSPTRTRSAAPEGAAVAAPAGLLAERRTSSWPSPWSAVPCGGPGDAQVARESSTRSAAEKLSPAAVKALLTTTQRMPAALAARRPHSVSSTTTQSAGRAPSAFAAWRSEPRQGDEFAVKRDPNTQPPITPHCCLGYRKGARVGGGGAPLCRFRRRASAAPRSPPRRHACARAERRRKARGGWPA